jgi:diguanylate cyclase
MHVSMFAEAYRLPQGVNLAHETIEELKGLGVSPAPQYYEVWSSHRAQLLPELTTLIQKMLQTRDGVTEEKLERLHERFFTGAKISAQVLETGVRIARELTEVVAALETAGLRTDEFGARLEKSAAELKAARDPDSIRQMVATLIDATQEMSEQNRVLSARLQNSTREVESLRSTLRQARAEALTDSLTGVANRKHFDEALRWRKAEADVEGAPLSLAFCDIDHFKRFNDNWGHQTGDQIIKFVGGAIQKLAYRDHLVARYGGEEFAVVMPRTNLDAGTALCEQMRGAIENKRLVRRATNEDLGTVTASFGVVEYQPGENVHDFIERADACLYAAKRAGRNRVMTRPDNAVPTAA